MPATDLERLVVTLEAATKQYERGLAKAQQTTVSAMRKIERDTAASMKRQEAQWAAAGKRLGAAFKGGLAALGLGSAIGTLNTLRSLTKEVADIGDNAERASLDVEKFQELVFALRQAGGDESGIVTMFQKLARSMNEAILKGNDLQKILAANNVPLTDASGKLRPTLDVFFQISDLIKNSKSDADRLTIATSAMGRSAGDYVNFLAQGSEAIRAQMQSGREMGAIIDREMVAKAQEFDDKLDAALQTMKALAVTWTINISSNIGDVLAMVQKLFALLNNMPDLGGINEQFARDKAANLAKGMSDWDAHQKAFQGAMAETNRRKATREAQQDLNRLNDTANQLRLRLKQIEDGGLNIDTTPLKAQIAQIEKRVGRIGGQFKQFPVPPDHRPEAPDIRGRVIKPAPKIAPVDDETELPFLGSPKGGGRKRSEGGGAARGGKADDPLENIKERIQQLEIERATLGMTTGAAAAYEEKQRAINDAIAAGHPLTAEQIAQLTEMAGQLATATDALADAREAIDTLRSAFEAVSSNLENAFDEWLETGKIDVKKFVDSVIKDLARLAFQKGIQSLFFGSASQGGNGGLFGMLLGGFGGFFAKGGTPPRGKVSVVGEEGPELLVGDGRSKVIPFPAMPRMPQPVAASRGGPIELQVEVVNSMTQDLDSRVDVRVKKAAPQIVQMSVQQSTKQVKNNFGAMAAEHQARRG